MLKWKKKNIIEIKNINKKKIIKKACTCVDFKKNKKGKYICLSRVPKGCRNLVKNWYQHLDDVIKENDKNLGKLEQSPKKKSPKKKSPKKKSEKKIILILKSAEDHNGAFDKDGDRGLFTVFQSYIDLRKNELKNNNYEMIYIDKISNVYQIHDILNNIKYKIAHLIIMSHGNVNSLYLSHEGVIKSNTKEMDILANSLREKLLPHASILLHSCLVGEGGPNAYNFSSNLAKKIPGHIIYGSEKSINRGDLDLQFIFTSEEDGSLLPIYHIEKYPLYDFCYKNDGKKC